MTALRIKYTPLDVVKGWPGNPKAHDAEGISASIIRHGFCDPLTVDERTGQLVEGHGRVEALLALQASGSPAPEGVSVRRGVWCVPVVRGVSFESDEQAQAYLLAHNRLAERGGWSEQALEEMLRGLSADADLFWSTGFSDSDLAFLSASVESAAALAQGAGTTVTAPLAEWDEAGMPVFEQENLPPFREIVVKLGSVEDVTAFEALLGQKTPVTTAADKEWRSG